MNYATTSSANDGRDATGTVPPLVGHDATAGGEEVTVR